MVPTRDAFSNAYRKGLWRGLVRRVRHECNDLLPVNRVLSHISDPSFRYLGKKPIPLDRIVGSAGRSSDFDLSFNPRREGLKPRWLGVASAALLGEILHPIEVLQVGDAYIVEDGNHRVSVARWLGKSTIQARVVQLDPAGLTENPNCRRLGYKA